MALALSRLLDGDFGFESFELIERGFIGAEVNHVV
jgi:hypothetical protein